MGTSLAIYEKMDNPLAMATDKQMMIAVSGMTGCAIEVAPAVMLTCICEGMTPMDYLRNYHPVNGRPTKQTQAAVADFLTLHGGQQKIVEFGPEQSVLEFTDKHGATTTWTLTLADAHEAGWPFAKDGKTYKENWCAPVKRADMLYYRNASRALKKVCPSVFAGLMTSEEAADLDVVATTITTNAPQPISAKELIASAAARPAIPASLPPAIAQESPSDPSDIAVIDAEFEPVAEPVPTPFDADQAPEAEPETVLGEGYITGSQVERLRQLYDECNISWEKQQEALAKRGVKAIHSLPQAEAQGMIDRLTAWRAQQGNP